MVVSQGGYVFPGTKCDELEGQVVAEARLYHQSSLPHLVAGDLGSLFPKAEACAEPGDQDPDADNSLEERGLRKVEKDQGLEEGKLRGSIKRSLGYFAMERKGDTLNFVKKKKRGKEVT